MSWPVRSARSALLVGLPMASLSSTPFSLRIGDCQRKFSWIARRTSAAQRCLDDLLRFLPIRGERLLQNDVDAFRCRQLHHREVAFSIRVTDVHEIELLLREHRGGVGVRPRNAGRPSPLPRPFLGRGRRRVRSRRPSEARSRQPFRWFCEKNPQPMTPTRIGNLVSNLYAREGWHPALEPALHRDCWLLGLVSSPSRPLPRASSLSSTPSVDAGLLWSGSCERLSSFSTLTCAPSWPGRHRRARVRATQARRLDKDLVPRSAPNRVTYADGRGADSQDHQHRHGRVLCVGGTAE